MLTDEQLLKYRELGYSKVFQQTRETTFESKSYILILKPYETIFRHKPTVGSMVKDIVTTIVSIPTPAPENVVTHREAICKGCTFHSGNTCRACGCYTPAKLRITTARCPVGKW